MSNIFEPTPAQIKSWVRWVARRPLVVRDVCRKLAPWKLYMLKSTGQRVTLHSANEDGTVTVDITGTYNLIMFNKQVFGIDPNDLEECDLPAKDKPLGEYLPPGQRLAFINARRAENGLAPLDTLD